MSAHPFRTGALMDMRQLSRARSFCHGAADALSIALAFDGMVDSRRDEVLAEAEAALNEALRLIDEARHPTPPKIAPPEPVLPTLPPMASGLALAAEILGLNHPATEIV